jgi:hypothetical protein
MLTEEGQWAFYIIHTSPLLSSDLGIYLNGIQSPSRQRQNDTLKGGNKGTILQAQGNKKAGFFH